MITFAEYWMKRQWSIEGAEFQNETSGEVKMK